MVYIGTYTTEVIAFHVAGNYEDPHYIELQKHCELSTFRATCCCDEKWVYEFDMSNPSNYELVKFNIMETIFRCEDMDELLTALSRVFEEGFANILIKNGHNCDGNCENCTCKD